MARLVAAAASSAQALEKLQQFTVSPIFRCLFRNHLKFLFGFVWFVMALPILVGAVIPSVVYMQCGIVRKNQKFPYCEFGARGIDNSFGAFELFVYIWCRFLLLLLLLSLRQSALQTESFPCLTFFSLPT